MLLVIKIFQVIQQYYIYYINFRLITRLITLHCRQFNGMSQYFSIFRDLKSQNKSNDYKIGSGNRGSQRRPKLGKFRLQVLRASRKARHLAQTESNHSSSRRLFLYMMIRSTVYYTIIYKLYTAHSKRLEATRV